MVLFDGTHTSQLIVAVLWAGASALLPEKFDVKSLGFFCFSNGAFYFCCLMNSYHPVCMADESCARCMTGLWMWQLWLCPPYSHHRDKNKCWTPLTILLAELPADAEVLLKVNLYNLWRSRKEVLQFQNKLPTTEKSVLALYILCFHTEEKVY